MDSARHEGVAALEAAVDPKPSRPTEDSEALNSLQGIFIEAIVETA